jgi:hypothetical protein
MIQIIRNSRITKFIASFVAISLLIQIFSPTQLFALTSGPSQPEVQSFEPIGTTEMVDPFTGDFTYNIPLLDVEGYPINICYHSGITMDQEASWVGLGWNINPGAITRELRGIPDDFDGENITTKMNLKDNITYGGQVGVGAEIFGFDAFNLHLGLGIDYNNYIGITSDLSAGATFSLAKYGATELTASLGISTSSDQGLTVSPSVSLGISAFNKNEKLTGSFSAGTSFNSREGIKAISFDGGLTFSSAAKSGKKITTSKITKDRTSFVSGGLNSHSTISLMPNTHIPSISMEMKNYSITFAAKVGGTAFGFDGDIDAMGHYSKQKIKNKSVESPAYGYMYCEDGQHSDNALLDFNREKDGSFGPNTPAIALTNLTYDIFSVSGQGMNGMFRPYRSDFGYVFDKRSESVSASDSYEFEANIGNLGKGGGNYTRVDVNSSSTAWLPENHLAQELGFKTKSSVNTSYEPYFFKMVGDRSVDPEKDLFTEIGEENPVRAEIIEVGPLESRANSKWTNGFTNSDPIVYQSQNRTKRQPRNDYISIVTKGDYSKYGLYSQDDYYYNKIYSEIENEINNDQIAEITVTKPDGVRYVYGLPAYNKKYKEVAFNVSDRAIDISKGLVTYNSGSDNSESNTRGVDNFYSSRELPPYVHSFMITAILSPDYIDLTGDGPSRDDYGTYTKFSYTQIEDYGWRVPYGEDQANFDERNKTVSGDKGDDQGNYIYGVKDVWYLNKIEGKKYYAVFSLSDRDDCLGVNGENGVKDFQRRLKKLDKIMLYTIPNSDGPVKTVHFEYGYNLCKGIPNSMDEQNSGKLTLKSIYFTYRDSNKAKYNPYTFDYQEDDLLYNPNYNFKAFDRWGNYKPNLSNINNTEFPYTEQNETEEIRNKYASAWHLKEIILPSSGKINIDYESDDYAYVQDRPAMQMYRLINTSTNLSEDTELLIELDEEIQDNYDFYNKYLKDVDTIYFRSLTQVNFSHTNGGMEYVSGYATINDYNFENQAGQKIGKILLNPIVINHEGSNQNLNPISYAAIQYGRNQTPNEVFNANVNFNDDPIKVLTKLLSGNIVENLIESFMGQEAFLAAKGIGKKFIPQNTWIRLLNPTKCKFGGGSRVHMITINDNWSNMANEEGVDQYYGQIYNYKTTENGVSISSGVAAYEPLIGGDENPFKLPVAIDDFKKAILGPDERSYLEEPFGESFFPSPMVGYSRVEVRNIKPADLEDLGYPLFNKQITRHGSGKMVYEFYTAKDYPVITQRTDLKKLPQKSEPKFDFFNQSYKEYMTASQGFVIEINDMHGKPKATLVYGEGKEEPMSGVRYYYKDNGTKEMTAQGREIRKNGNKLVNEFTAVNKKGEFIENAMVGLDYDFISDMRQQETEMESSSDHFNLYLFLAWIIPIVVPTFYITNSSQDTRFRSVSTTKVIQRFGILDETVSFDRNENSEISQKNLALDQETGEVLLSQVNNEYNDQYFTFNYPAHWMYEGMGSAYTNTGGVFEVTIMNNDGVIFESPENLPEGSLINGNQVGVYNNQGDFELGWIWYFNYDYYLFNKAGVSFPIEDGPFTLRIIRSARRNQATTPVGSFVSNLNPLETEDNDVKNVNELIRIQNASAVVYSDKWDNLCDCTFPFPTTNPFIKGKEGNWRLQKSYNYLTERQYSKESVSLRESGFYSQFSSFWIYNDVEEKWETNESGWKWQHEVTQYSPYGYEIENVDAMGIYSSAMYRNYIPAAVSQNAKQNEVSFDDFEDYPDPYSICNDGHFDFLKDIPNPPQYISTDAHTGKSSIKVGSNQVLTTTKPLSSCDNK